MSNQLSYGGFWRRTGALIIDFLVFAPITALYWILFQLSPGVAIVSVVVFGALPFVYHVLFHARWGQTLGKMATKVRVIATNGEPIGLKRALLRSLVDIVLWLAFASSMAVTLASWGSTPWRLLGWADRFRLINDRNPFYTTYEWASQAWMWSEVVVLLLNRRRRALHDFIAGTVVVKVERSEERSQPLPPPVPMPQ